MPGTKRSPVHRGPAGVAEHFFCYAVDTLRVRVLVMGVTQGPQYFVSRGGDLPNKNSDMHPTNSPAPSALYFFIYSPSCISTALHHS